MSKNKVILITGAKGFIGSHVTRYFKDKGYTTYGIGHGDISIERCLEIGLDYWIKATISIKVLKELNQNFHLIVHAGGSGSVNFSVEHPYDDFNKTVNGTLEILEYMRIYDQKSLLIYPSSPAVHGECENIPIKETFKRNPSSPYGFHKKIVEDLCKSYSIKYNIRINIIRLYSVYGENLQKQLLWDATKKILNSKDDVEFWGTGQETRDFIHIDDVLSLIKTVLKLNYKFLIINGGTGNKFTVSEVINLIQINLKTNKKIIFNNIENKGNPKYYCASMNEVSKLGWYPKIHFETGLRKYIEWTLKNENNCILH